jgi:V8-like Glu-specific endopeptidase
MYDYGTAVLDDLNMTTGYISFGTDSAADLDYDDINSAGYPGRSFTCAASPVAGGICGGYMYRQFQTTKAVTATAIYHQHDTQNGQSGMGLYDWLPAQKGGSKSQLFGIKGSERQ